MGQRAAGMESKSVGISFATPVTSLAGVGPTRGQQLADLGVNTLGELLEYFPRTYQHETEERAINQLDVGPIQTARGKVVAVDYIPVRPRPRFEATLDDGTGVLACVWFNGAYLRRTIHPGITLRVKGKVGSFRNIPQMTQPKFWNIDENAEAVTESQFRPIYPASAKLSSEQIQKIVEPSLEVAVANVEEWFPESIMKRRGLIARRDADPVVHPPARTPPAPKGPRRPPYGAP